MNMVLIFFGEMVYPSAHLQGKGKVFPGMTSRRDSDKAPPQHHNQLPCARQDVHEGMAK